MIARTAAAALQTSDRCLLDCSEQWPDLTQEVHDRLLHIEDDIAQATYALLVCETYRDLGLSGEHFDRFVVAHTGWRNPVGVHAFALHAQNLMDLVKRR